MDASLAEPHLAQAADGASPLSGTGVQTTASVHANLTAPQLIAHAIRRKEGRLSADGALIVSGMVAARIGDLAFEHGVRLHELTVVRASLEEAFMELTADSVEYQAKTGAQK